MRATVIIPAAGSSSRHTDAGGVRHKLDEDLGDRPVLHRAVELFTTRDEVVSIVVAGPHDPDDFEAFRERHGAKLGFYGVTLCRGGATHRWQSVKAALKHADETGSHIAVHDAARPGTPEELIDRVFEAASRFDAVIPGVPVADTVRRVGDEPDAHDADPLDAIFGGGGRVNAAVHRVTGEVSRDGLFAIQTPQVFEQQLLMRAYAQPDLGSTDDASLVARLGVPIRVVAGDARNIKITTPADLDLMRALLRVGPPKQRPPHQRF